MTRAQLVVEAAKARLFEAKAVFAHALERVDQHLQHAVTLDPAVLEDAQAVQENYRSGYLAKVLRPIEQPASPEPETPAMSGPYGADHPGGGTWDEIPTSTMTVTVTEAAVQEPPMTEDGQ